MASNNIDNVLARILSVLNNSKEQVEKNALYQAVKSLLNASKLINNDVKANTANVTNIVNNITPSNTVEDLDGSNDPGVSNSYSRGDHKHDYGVNSIDYDRIQQVSAASKLLGRGTAGGSNVREITLGTNLSMSGDTLNASGGVSVDYVVLSDGVVAGPTPVNDGAGNFIYIPYVP